MPSPSLAYLLTSGGEKLVVYLKQLRPLKENLKGALRAPCLSTITPPPEVMLVVGFYW